MPVLRYTWKHPEGHEVTDEQLFRFDNNLQEMLLKEEPIFKARGDIPAAELIKIVVVNPHLHLHEWQRTHLERSSMRYRYYCKRCQATGWRNYNIIEGERGEVNRDEAYKNDKQFKYCHDPLKAMPKPKELKFE